MTERPSDDAAGACERLDPDEPRYQAVLAKQFNKRYRARPDYIRVAHRTEHVITAVEAAVRAKLRVVVTSGGHCLEGFVSDPEVRVIIDVSPMNRIYFDEARRAIAIEAGATVGEAFRALYERWRTVVPLGEYPGIGIGGHIVGGAFGFLCREHGLAADYLYAVEVVTVDAAGRASAVVATRDATDPLRELWWAHTGGGGGNFGVVTRYWFRAPDASGSDPSELLPRAPESIATLRAEWSWDAIDRPAFLRLLQNHGRWSEENSDPASPNASMFSLLELHTRTFGKLVLRCVSTAGERAERQMDAFVRAVSEGIAAPSGRDVSRMSWLEFALAPFPDLFAQAPEGGVRSKVKDALLRTRFTDTQIEVAYEHLTRGTGGIPGGMLGLASYGGRVNRVAPDATASSQRAAILDIACNAGWLSPDEDAESLAWARDFYAALFADTGGVPVPGPAYEGALINHPDTDLADPTFNRSGVAWHTLYYKQNYPRLQRIKAAWDPRDVFRHALSIRPS